MVQPLWKTERRSLTRLRIELPCGSALPRPAVYPEETRTGPRRDGCPPMSIAALVKTAKVRKHPTCPSADARRGRCGAQTRAHAGGRHSATRTQEILPFATTRMDAEGIMLSEMSRTQRDKYHLISLLRGT